MAKKVYGNSIDLDNAKSVFGNKGYEYILMDSLPGGQSFGDNDILLGGLGAGYGGGGNPTRLWGADRDATKNLMSSYYNNYGAKDLNSYYLGLAQNVYDPMYNSKVTSLKNAANRQIAAFEGQKGALNQSYDTQVENQNLMSTLNKNNLQRQMLSRGMGRSSMATTNMSAADLKNARLVSQLNQARANSLNSLEGSKTAISAGLEDTLSTMALDRENELKALASQYEDRDYKRDWEKEQFEQKMALEREKMAQELAIAKMRGAGSGGGYDIPVAQIKKATWLQLNDILNKYPDGRGRGAALSFLKENRDEMVDTIGYDEYAKMFRTVNEQVTRTANERRGTVGNQSLNLQDLIAELAKGGK